MINKVILEGRLTKDIELRTTNAGKKVATVSIALNRGKNAQGVDLGADYPTVQLWEKMAEMAAKWFRKGDGITVVGRLQTRSWDDNGVKRFATEVVAENITFPEGKKAEAAAPAKTNNNIPYSPFSFIDSDDLPF